MKNTLNDRMRPMMYFCHLYGMGFCARDGFWIRPVVYFSPTLVNMLASVYVYGVIYVHVQSNMTVIYDLSMIMCVVRLHFRFLAPPLMIAFLTANKTSILRCIDAIDDLVPSLRRASLIPSSLHFFGWLTVTLVAEFLQILAFNVRTEYAFGSAQISVQFVLSNVWIVTPVMLYTFLVSVIRRGILDINDDVTSIRAWTTRRHRWKRLHRMAVDLTRSEFGAIIIVFVLCTVMEITFFLYALYLSCISHFTSEIVTYTLMLSVRSGLALRLFRTCHNCKNDFQYTSLHLLHMDFNFMPCSVFNITYRNLITITMMIFAYLAVQIQMSPGF